MNLLSPLTIRSVTLRNRIAVSPMCQYSSTDGFANDWHLVHLGSRAAGGAAFVCVEATAVTAQGRISPGDMGLYKDDHIEFLSRIAKFVESMGAVPAIQLAHAGRKASCAPPFQGGKRILPENGGWDVVAPSPVPFNPGDPAPIELDHSGIQSILDAFTAAARRAVEAGFKIIEIHSAHGYLLHEFLSPIANHRTDEYGGSLHNRMRLSLAVADAIRRVIPDKMPLFTRISCTDWLDENAWDLDQSIELSKNLKSRGVDLIDCSSGAIAPGIKIPVAPGFQVPFAAAIREQAHMLTGAVGMITEPAQANEIVESGKADLALLAREMLREPYWALKAEQSLGETPHWPTQYGYAVKPINTAAKK